MRTRIGDSGFEPVECNSATCIIKKYSVPGIKWEMNDFFYCEINIFTQENPAFNEISLPTRTMGASYRILPCSPLSTSSPANILLQTRADLNI